MGFMAVGKSAVGRTLAKKLRRRFVDLDKHIEKKQGMKIREIFEQKGEAYFRAVEKECLAEVLNEENQIIATGGGVINDEENFQSLRNNTLLIGLTASVDVLSARAGKGNTRPLLKGGNRRERIEELLRIRQDKYNRANILIDTSDLTVDQVADKIISLAGLDR